MRETDASTELLGHRERDPLRAAHEAVLLRAVARAREPVHSPAGVRVEERVQERVVGRLGREHGRRVQAQQIAALARAAVPLDPGLEGLGVPLLGAGRAPRGLERHPPGEVVEPGLGLADVGEDERVDARDRALVATLRLAEAEQVLTLVVGGEGVDPEVDGEPLDPVLRRPDPLAAHLDHHAVIQLPVHDPAADAVARLDDDDLTPAGKQRLRRAEPRQPCSHDDDVGLDPFGHEPRLRSARLRSLRGVRGAGVDGCRGGWVCVFDGTATVHAGFAELIAALPTDALVGVDMPVGLLDGFEPGGREADRLARARLGPVRGTSVFSAPPRAALERWRGEPDYLSAKATVDGHLTKQAFFILDKIAEVDDFVRAHGQDRVVEIHPELGFMELAGTPLLEPKRGLAGRARRRARREGL